MSFVARPSVGSTLRAGSWEKPKVALLSGLVRQLEGLTQSLRSSVAAPVDFFLVFFLYKLIGFSGASFFPVMSGLTKCVW